MALPDFAMGKFFRLVTRWTPDEIDEIEIEIESGALSPRDAKMKLAREITTIFYGSDESKRAEDAFIQVFQQRGIPEDMKEYKLQEGDTVLGVLRAGDLVSSNSDGRRMIQQNAVSLDGEKLTDPHAPMPGGGVLRVGRRKWLRIVE